MNTSYCTQAEALLKAIPLRHSVRSFKNKAIDAQAVEALTSSVAWLNDRHGLHIQLVLDEPTAFNGWHSYGKFTGVRHYIVMAGPKGPGLDPAVGYCGEQLVLHAQALGLNTCWVGMTYKKVNGAFRTAPGEKVACVIALGYGETQGVAHPVKSLDDICLCQGQKGTQNLPEWFVAGARAALLAPTAVNQQKFSFEYLPPRGAGQTGVNEGDGQESVNEGDGQVSVKENDKLPGVKAHKGFSMFGYTQLDMGIARLHFELGAGAEHFRWV